ETHVHVALTLAPTILISDLVGKLKGASAHEANQKITHGRKVLERQTGHGGVSFGEEDLKWGVEYDNIDEEHHAGGLTHDRPERIAPLEAGAKAEQREAP